MIFLNQRIGRERKGFSLIELMVVIGITSLMMTLLYASFSSIRARERDKRRLADIRMVQLALETYWNKFGNYPPSDGNGMGGWDTPGDGTFLTPLVSNGLLPGHVFDPKENDAYGNYRYYLYPAGTNGCNISNGEYYVLGIVDEESIPSEITDPASPGFACGSVDWQEQFDWVTGKFRY